VPQKLDDCVAKVKGQKGVDNPWAICNAQLGKETKEHHNPMDIPTGHELNKTQEDHATTQRGHDKNSSDKIYGSIKAEIVEAKIREHVGDNEFLVKNKNDKRVNANRQVPLFNPPITNRDVKPKINKTTKGIGGQVGKIDSTSNTNNMTTDMWKKILDTQLRRNVKEPRY